MNDRNAGGTVIDEAVSAARLRQIATGRGEGGVLLSADEQAMAVELLAARAALVAADRLADAVFVSLGGAMPYGDSWEDIGEARLAYLRARGAP